VLRNGDLVEHVQRAVEYEPVKIPSRLLGIVVGEDDKHPGFFRVYWYTTSRLQIVFNKNLKLYEERK
jgi:hypothetical protein